MRNILNPKDYQEIESRLNDLKRDDLPIWGKMNSNEMLCHCADQIKVSLGEIETQDQSTFVLRNIVINLLYLGMKVPKGIKTFDETNPQIAGSKPVNFESDKTYLIKKINEFIGFKESDLKPHGAFGKLSKKKWGRLIYKHLDYHLNQFGS